MPGLAVRVSTGVFSTLRYSRISRKHVAAGHAQDGRVDVRVGVAHDGADVLGLRVPLEDELEAQDVAVEGDRALEVGDLDAGVMGAR